MTPPTPQEEQNYHLDRIASSLESIAASQAQIAETNRVAHEINIDALAKNNELTDSLQGAIGGLFGLGNAED